MSTDPVISNPDHYSVVFENEFVRVLDYHDVPGVITSPHTHPDSVMCTMSAFRRRLHAAGRHADVQLEAGAAVWLPAQEHYGENIGDTPTHVMFVELKGPEHQIPGGAVGPQ